jgi:catechol 2,3-dioxygenase-like lactoylglutathione lyase family enzyme
MKNTNKVHISLNVKDINSSVDFYKNMFGIEPMKHFDDYAKFDVENPALNLTLNKGSFMQGGSVSHLGVQVNSTEEVLATREGWNKRGLLTKDEMQVDCCYATQDKTWIKDPDGNEWEVFVVLENISEDRMKNAESSCCVPAPVGIGEQQSESVQGCC